MARRTEPEAVAEVAAEEPDPEPELAAEETPEPPEPSTGSWRVLTRVRYEKDGDEFVAGAGEIIDDEAAAQVDPDSIEPAG